MLVLSRKESQRLTITVGTTEIVIVVDQIRGNRVILAIDAPEYIHIRRSELPPRSILPSKPTEVERG